MIYECVSCLWLQRREYLYPLLRGDKGCVIFLSIKENSHTPCPLSRGEGVTNGRYEHTHKSSFIDSKLERTEAVSNYLRKNIKTTNTYHLFAHIADNYMIIGW